ncbi:MAG: DEAD/DEAH box helicase family protein [Bacteroidaceae bacterium]|nr:DEAD/DEAH box helicase family protein [Bacteroidaceae bacterium]
MSDPEKSALNGRRALEWLVRAIYELKNIEVGERTSLYTLIDGEPFKQFIGDERLMMAVHYIRKAGNSGAHLGEVTKKQSFFALLNLHNVVGASLVKLRVFDSFPVFDKTLIPTSPDIHIEPAKKPEPTPAFVESVDMEQVADAPAEPHDTGISEAETRKYFIDIMLEEAGWQVLSKEGVSAPLKAGIEIEVSGMPNNEGKGYADYVLFGSNGKPLAVVEAKRTTASPEKGKHQAELYADCLEKQYGVRPVIYYTNGYRTQVIDGLGYPPRTVYGYHTAEDLELLIQRRGRSSITDLHIKDEITNRDYQKMAIRSVCERFNNMHRRTLLVMATGTGKTRVSISLVDVLARNGWVKNVLFLADRTALVKQAAKNYSKLLPSFTTCILSEDKEPDMAARIMFSTYQTMINYIDTDSKGFSVGRFDLVIIDEAHRSVFGKYTAIFDYFDCLLVGLTATPRDEVEHNTFELFKIDEQDTFAYELGEAVADKYLVPYNGLKRGTSILANGIKYDSLSKEEKEQFEEIWKYEKAKKALAPTDKYSRNIESSEMFTYIYNIDTIDKVLQDLMQNGIKVQNGERIGKTIIFAYRHDHAELIVERFGVLFPEYGSDFCVLIDNRVTYAQDLINKFEVRDGMPQIAVTVDMLDTGIDVPDILNLVFFKPVHSKIKFWQMIGRGTRLSENIFGVDKHKENFIIFDWCNNFEFFSQNPNGKESVPQQSLTERLFCVRTDIAVALQHANYQAQAFVKGLHDSLKAELRSQVTELQETHISVRQHWEAVDKFRKEQTWVYLSSVDAVLLKEEVAPLISKSLLDEKAKLFDLLMYSIEISLLVPEVNSARSQRKVVDISLLLQERASIPQVAAKMPIIKSLSESVFWESPTLDRLEYVRVELREIIKFLVGSENRKFTIDIEDTVIDKGQAETLLPRTYKQKIVDYLAEHRSHPAIQKIVNIEQLTREDIVELERIMWKELGTKEEYQKYVASGNMLCGDCVAAFVRSQVGVDRAKALEAFSSFIGSNVLNSMQEEYLKTIITYVCSNGDITPATLMTKAPFDAYKWQTVFGQHLICVKQFVDKLHNSIVA